MSKEFTHLQMPSSLIDVETFQELNYLKAENDKMTAVHEYNPDDERTVPEPSLPVCYVEGLHDTDICAGKGEDLLTGYIWSEHVPSLKYELDHLIKEKEYNDKKQS